VLLQCKRLLSGCAGEVRALPAADTDKDGALKFYRFLAALVSGYVGHMRKDGSCWNFVKANEDYIGDMLCFCLEC